MRSSEVLGSDEPLVERIADEILERQRAGERPTVEEYCRRYPDFADVLRDFLPALLVVEGLKPNSKDSSGTFGGELDVEGEHREFIGDYRILRELGRGGMGVVYEAEQQSLGRHVALKVLLRRVAEDTRAAKRFEIEAKAAARMHHTNIVPVFDVGCDNDSLYYAMQLIQGQAIDLVIEDLKHLRKLRGSSATACKAAQDQDKSIARSLEAGQFDQDPLLDDLGSLSQADTFPEVELGDKTETLISTSASAQSAVLPGQRDMSSAEDNRPAYCLSIARIGQQTADALAYAHARGIIHRDIKPSNLLLDGNGIVWITDFGLAKTSDHGMTHTGDILGTIRYMSPERFKGQCDVRADVYSLGLTLYELLTLKTAFAAPDQLKLIDMILKSEPPSPRALDPSVPRDLETIILKCIDKDPRRRYQSADELSEDLERFIHDEPIKARRISLRERVVRWSRRNKAMATSLAIVAILLLVMNIAGTLITWRMATLKDDAVEAREAAERSRNLADEKASDALRAQRLAAEQAETINRNLYFASMNLASVAASSPGGIERVAMLTDEWFPEAGQPDLRGWEWYYLRSLMRQDLHSLEHGSPVTSVTWSPDGKRLASCNPSRQQGAEDTIKIWDAESGELLKTLASHGGPVFGVSWSPDGTRLASCSADFTVRIWDVNTAKVVRTLEGHTGAPWQVVWSPDGKRIASVCRRSDTRILVWNAETGEPTVLTPSYRTRHLSWSPDGNRLASGGDTGRRTQNNPFATIWDAESGKPVQSLPLEGRITTAMAWSPDGTHVLTCDRRSVKVWEINSGELVGQVMEDGSVLAVAWSPASTHFATGLATSAINIWETDKVMRVGSTNSSEPESEVSTAKPSLTLRGHVGRLSSLAWSSDGETLASGCNDGTAKIWDVAQLSPQKSGSENGAYEGKIETISWNRDGAPCFLSHEEGTSKLWHQAGNSYKLITDFDLGRPFTISPDGRRAAGYFLDGVGVWDAKSGDLLTSWSLPASPTVMSWDPDSTRLALASFRDDNLVRIFDADTGQQLQVLSGHTQTVRSIAWSDDGTRLASGPMVGDSTVRIWDVAAGDCLKELPGHKGIVFSLAWSPDGKTLASGAEDNMIFLWDMDSYEKKKTLWGHDNFLTSLTWSPDSRRLASTGRDDQLIVWDTQTGREAFSLPVSYSDSFVHRPDGFVSWSPDGLRIATISEGKLRVLDASKGYAFEKTRQQQELSKPAGTSD